MWRVRAVARANRLRRFGRGAASGGGGAPPPPPPTLQTIPGELHLEGSTAGSAVLVSNVRPLRPGDLTVADLAAGRPAVFVGGVEKAVYVEAIRGRHPDDSLRGILVQYEHNIPDATPIATELRLDTVRTTVDRAKVNVTEAVVWNTGVSPYTIKAMDLPTDPSYLCETRVSGSPLVPADSVDAVSYPFFVAYADDRFEALKNTETTSGSALSDYEHPRGLVALWCMTGDRKYLRQALSRARYLFTYSNDKTPSEFSPTYNLEGLSGGSGLIGAEPKTQRMWTWFVGYNLTAWPSFYAIANAGAQQGMRSGITRSYAYPENVAYETSLSPRKHLQRTPYVWIGALMDATRSVSGPTGGSVPGAQMPTQIAKIWTDLAADTFTEIHAGGTGWRTGFPWAHEKYRDDDPSATQGDWPWFQSALACRHLVDYYLMVQAESTIPPLVQLMCDQVALQCTTSTGGVARQGSSVTSATMGGVSYTFDNPVYSVPYLTRRDPALNNTMNCWTFPMWSVGMAFCHAYYGGNAADGTPWLTWYRRTVNPRLVWHTGANNSGLTWNWKIWAEMYGANLVAPWLIAHAGQLDTTLALRTPIVHTTWPT